MYSAYGLAGYKQVAHRSGLAVGAYIYAAVLIMQRRIDQNRFFSYINTVFTEHPQHGGNTLFDGAFAAKQFYHRGIQPYSFAVGGFNAVVAHFTFSYYAGRSNVARFQRIDKRIAVLIDQLSAQRTHFFRHQSAENLSGFGHARGMVLQCVGIKQLCSGAIREHQTVGGCSVMVAGGETLIMQSARSARAYNDGLCLGNENFARLHIKEYGAGRIAVFVFNYFDRRGKIDYGNTTV